MILDRSNPHKPGGLRGNRRLAAVQVSLAQAYGAPRVGHSGIPATAKWQMEVKRDMGRKLKEQNAAPPAALEPPAAPAGLPQEGASDRAVAESGGWGQFEDFGKLNCLLQAVYTDHELTNPDESKRLA